MGTLTLTYGAASVAGLSALVLVAAALMQRFGVAPIPPTHGTGVSSAAQLVATSAAAPNAAHSTTTAVDRKADDRVLPRGRRL